MPTLTVEHLKNEYIPVGWGKRGTCQGCSKRRKLYSMYVPRGSNCLAMNICAMCALFMTSTLVRPRIRVPVNNARRQGRIVEATC